MSERRVITGAGGQLGRALAEAFPDARALTRADWDVTYPPPEGLEADLVLHAAAWTNVDGAEDDPQSAAAVNVGGTLNAASLGAPLVTWSTDYVFDGTKRAPYLESDAPSPLGVYARTKLHAEAAAGERAAELPAGAGDQDATSRGERIGDCVLQRWRTRGSFHGIPCSSGSTGSYSSVT